MRLTCLIAVSLFSVHLAGAWVWSAQVPQWRVIEFELSSQKTYDRPGSVEIVADFTAPDGSRFQQPAFWDGGKIWKIRFAPTIVGEWRFATLCRKNDDDGLCGRTENFSALPPTGDNAIYAHGGFLRVSDNRRYLTYSDGTPFFWLGDTWWFCPSKRCPIESSSNPKIPSMYRSLIDTRRKQGFTIVQMAFLDSENSLSTPIDPESWTEANLEYWRSVDRYLSYANDAGIIPVIGIGFHKNLDKVGMVHLERLWRYAIARYGAFAVTWLIVGEYNLQNDLLRVKKALALGRFIKETDPYKRAMTIHPWFYSRENRQAWGQPWYDFIMFQGGHESAPPVDLYLKAYGRTPTKPILESESHYEGYQDADQVRLAAYRAIQSGSFGYTYGVYGLWNTGQGPVPWWEAAGKPGSAQMKLLREIYESVEWWALEPRPTLVETKEALKEERRILTKAKGNELYVIYFPKSNAVISEATLQGADAGARYSATWMSPVNSAKNFKTPTLVQNERGLVLPSIPDKEDWVLIVRKEPA